MTKNGPCNLSGQTLAIKATQICKNKPTLSKIQNTAAPKGVVCNPYPAVNPHKTIQSLRRRKRLQTHMLASEARVLQVICRGILSFANDLFVTSAILERALKTGLRRDLSQGWRWEGSDEQMSKYSWTGSCLRVGAAGQRKSACLQTVCVHYS